MLSIVGNDQLAPVAAEVKERLGAVVERACTAESRISDGGGCVLGDEEDRNRKEQQHEEFAEALGTDRCARAAAGKGTRDRRAGERSAGQGGARARARSRNRRRRRRTRLDVRRESGGRDAHEREIAAVFG